MISINGLNFGYNHQPKLFEDFNLEIQDGDLFGLVGPNGAGKSSLISIMCGLNRPLAGDIKVLGQDLSSNRKTILQNIAVVPQEYAFYPKLSARENLAFFVSLYRVKTKRAAIDNAVELTGLGSFLDRQARYYSGGMKRRLNLAIGLLNSPKLLILDEPTVGIDPQSRHFILEAIRQINVQGTTVLYTSHYMEEVERLCNRVAVIDHGRIILSGLLNELLATASIVRISISNINELKVADVTPIKQNFKLQIEGSEVIGELTDVNQCTELLQSLTEIGANISRLKYGEQSLESLFFELTDTQLREG